MAVWQNARRHPARLALLLAAGLVAGCGNDAPAGSPPAGAGPSPAAPVSPAGRIPVTVTQGTNLAIALSPDGKTLILSLQGVLFSLPSAGGTATRLTDDYQDAREPAWTPDGSLVVFHGYRSGTWDLWSLPAGGGDPLPLTTDRYDDREAQVSPGGSQVVFASDRSGNYDIWLLDRATGALRQLTHTPEDESVPAWSPDGTGIAYAAAVRRGRSELRRLDPATGATRTVIAEEGIISGVAWHPDGRRIGYHLGRPGETELRLIDASGGAPRPLSFPGDDVFPFRPVWQDPDTVLYTANGVIYRATADGSRSEVPFEATFELDRPAYERRRRNHDDASPRRALGLANPSISPDGKRVAFTALGDLWLWSPDEGALENLSNSPWAERSPRFSPDGGRIVYVSDRPATGASGLWIYHLGGKRHRHLDLAVARAAYPAWSPDGAALAFFAGIPGNPLAAQLTVARLDDGSLTTVGPPMPAQPISWSPDGAYVATTALAPYSHRYREGVYRLFVASPVTGERYQVEPVPHKNITDAALGPSGQFMTYVQDGQLWRLDLSEDFQPAGYPEPLTAGLTDSPGWSRGGGHLVFMSGDRMMRLNVATGATEDITPPIQWRPAVIDTTWTLKVGRLFDGTGSGYIENALITIDGNRIFSIRGDAADAEADVDHSGRAAFPGLFEMHAHMGEISESQGRAWLAYGITSVRDPGANPYVAKERQEAWNSGALTGPRTHVTGYLTDGNRVFYSVAEGIASDAHLERALERVEKLELDFIKTYVRLPDHRQRRVVAFAHRLGIPVTSHELFPAAALGADHVEHIGGTSRRGYAPKVSALGSSYQDVVRLLTASGMGITPTAVLPGYTVITREEPDLFDTPQFRHFYGEAGRQAAAGLARLFGAGAAETTRRNGKLLRDLAAADALMVTGTDAPFVPYGAGLHAELRLYARAGLTPAQILRAATVKSAEAAGVAHDIGTLRPGMIADLVIVDGDPLADIADADNVVMTVKNGRGYPLERLLQAPPADSAGTSTAR